MDKLQSPNLDKFEHSSLLTLNQQTGLIQILLPGLNPISLSGLIPMCLEKMDMYFWIISDR
jgi:hypothetical protein